MIRPAPSASRMVQSIALFGVAERFSNGRADAEAAKEAAVPKFNSKVHNAEWKAFSRLTKNRRRCPAQLRERAHANFQDAFRARRSAAYKRPQMHGPDAWLRRCGVTESQRSNSRFHLQAQGKHRLAFFISTCKARSQAMAKYLHAARRASTSFSVLRSNMFA